MRPPESVIKLDFELVERDADYFVRLNGPGISAEARFKDELLGGDTHAAKIIAAIGANRSSYDDINYVGTELLSALSSGAVKEAYENLRAARTPNDRILIRLTLPPPLRELPWEALYDEKVGSLAGDPNYSILRQPPIRALIPPFVERKVEALSMLCVIPSGSRLDTDTELNNIRHAGKHLEPELELEAMVDHVEPDQLHDALTKRTWDIVHYVGHGRVELADEDGEDESNVQVRLHDADGQDHWMDAAIFAQLFAETEVRLVVLNCCSADTPSPTRYLSGLGPYLMRKGIPAVVAMRYEIADTVAIRFSHSFYQNLFAGKTPGRVDSAVEAARAALLRNKQPGTDRGFITPVVYLADGYEQLFKLESRPPPAVEASPKPSASATMDFPSSLRTAFQEGDCIPVIGPAILRLGIFRRGTPMQLAETGPRELAESLAKQRPYNGFGDDLKIGRRAGEWMNAWLLHLVCQYYQDTDNRNRGNLLKKVMEAFKDIEPNDTIRSLVKWRVPAIFYTYFDGVMEQCLNESNAHLNAIVRSVVDAPVGDAGSIVNQRPLVLLRGSLSDPDSLVLTEEDHEGLIENVRKMHPSLSGIARRIGRSVLFLGVSPRDPLVRALSQQLLETGSKRKQGSTFFVWPGRNAADEAYWRRYGVEWIDQSPDEVIGVLNSL